MAAVKPLWDALYAYNADVVVNANSTVYERFAPQSPTAVADPLGIREFIVGTGGSGLQNPGDPRANSEVRNGTTYGIIKFVLDTAELRVGIRADRRLGIHGRQGQPRCHTRIGSLPLT